MLLLRLRRPEGRAAHRDLDSDVGKSQRHSYGFARLRSPCCSFIPLWPAMADTAAVAIVAVLLELESAGAWLCRAHAQCSLSSPHQLICPKPLSPRSHPTLILRARRSGRTAAGAPKKKPPETVALAGFAASSATGRPVLSCCRPHLPCAAHAIAQTGAPDQTAPSAPRLPAFLCPSHAPPGRQPGSHVQSDRSVNRAQIRTHPLLSLHQTLNPIPTAEVFYAHRACGA